jgi:hypothetical protein
VISRDLISGFSHQAQIFLQIVLVAGAFLCVWVVFNTRRTMNWLARLGPSSWPLRETSIAMANQRGWIWLYRVDCAIIFLGIAALLTLHWLAR